MQTGDSDFLLTGSTGFLGSIILKTLTESGYKVNKLGRNCTFEYPFDLLDSKLHFSGGIDTVIHCAGKAHFLPKNISEEEEFLAVNYEGTKNICNTLIKNQVIPVSFVFISTVSVYGVESGELINENHPLNGRSPYARSKILAENFLIDWAAKNKINLSILRLPLIAGKNPPGNLGAMINGISNGKYLSIGNASARKSIVWAEDIATLIVSLRGKNGIYNLTDGYHPTFKELEIAISSALNKNIPIVIPMFVAIILGKIGDVIGKRWPINSSKLNKISATLTFDDSRAKKELDWRPAAVLSKIKHITS